MIILREREEGRGKKEVARKDRAENLNDQVGRCILTLREYSLCPSPVPRISGLCSHPFSAFTLPTPVHYLNKQGGGGGEGWDRLAGSSSSSDGAASSDEQLSSHVGDEEGEVTGLRKGEASNEF